jgi:phage-related tail fiber protein
MKAIHVVLTTVLIALPAVGSAQTTKYERHHINARKENQQDRIAQGVKSGQLTAGETSKLEHQEAGINKEERGMRAQDNGHLTAQDRHTLAAQQNAESARIYRDKHNGSVQ